MKHTSKFILPLFALLLLAGCGSQKDVPYFQNSTDVDLSRSQYLYDARIMPKDQLTITVSCIDDQAAAPFNMTVPTPYSLTTRSTYSQPMLQTYLVDNDGNFQLPIVGQLHVGGLTMPQASEYITNLLVEGKHIPDAVVETRITNFTIYSLGGITPTKLVVPEAKINILQAVAQMGDLQARAKVKKVRVIREDDGQRMEFDIDMTTTALYDSPAFYLQQNDIVYAEPRKRSSSAWEKTLTGISFVAALASIAYTITYIMR